MPYKNLSNTKDGRSTNRMQKAYERKAILGMAVAGLSAKDNPVRPHGPNCKHVVRFWSILNTCEKKLLKLLPNCKGQTKLR